MKTTFPRSPRARVAEEVPGSCWEMEFGNRSEFVPARKRREAVEPSVLSLGCGFQVCMSYTVAWEFHSHLPSLSLDPLYRGVRCGLSAAGREVENRRRKLLLGLCLVFS